MDTDIYEKLQKYKRKDDMSWKLLLILAYISTTLLIALNLYIAYILYLFFSEDGFSLAGGLFIAASYIITLPVTLFSGSLIKKVRSRENPAPFFYLALGSLTALSGIILENASHLWIYLFIYGLLLSAVAAICMSMTKKDEDHEKIPAAAGKNTD